MPAIASTKPKCGSVQCEENDFITSAISLAGAGFATLNRYKEKCFLVKPLMRRLLSEGKLTGPPAELMRPMPTEMLFDTESDPYEINNLADSEDPEHESALTQMRAALTTWMTETGDRGHIAEPSEIVAPFEREMHDWFGTPDWVDTTANR